MGLYLTAVTINQACLAQGKVRRSSARWIACAVFFVGWCFVPLISDEFRRVEIGFALTAALLLGLLYLVYRSTGTERLEDVPDPGSTEELEAQFLAAEEGSS
jgi:drug/metabolite transporter (DMT)-like permease